MKWYYSVLVVLLLMNVSCIDVYDGEKRYVIEGTLFYGTEILKNEKVELFSDKIGNYSLSEEEEAEYLQPVDILPYGGYGSRLSTVTSDHNGNFRLGFPGGDNWVFYIKIKNKYYGYFSYRNMPNYYYNLGELYLDEDKITEEP